MAVALVKSATFPASLPDSNAPLVDNAGGVSSAWYRLFQALFNRTGAATGINGAQMAADDLSGQILTAMSQPIHGASAALPISVTPGPSPWVYQAPFSGSVNIHGGTVSKVEFSRDGGATYITLGANLAPVVTGDYLRVTYSATPTVTMIGA